MVATFETVQINLGIRNPATLGSPLNQPLPPMDNGGIAGRGWRLHQAPSWLPLLQGADSVEIGWRRRHRTRLVAVFQSCLRMMMMMMMMTTTTMMIVIPKWLFLWNIFVSETAHQSTSYEVLRHWLWSEVPCQHLYQEAQDWRGLQLMLLDVARCYYKDATRWVVILIETVYVQLHAYISYL